jgi:hypothetical protein
MIASSLREGDELVDLLLRKEADVNLKSTSGDFLAVAEKEDAD